MIPAILLSLLLVLLTGIGFIVAGRLARQRRLTVEFLQTEQQRLLAEQEAIVVEERRMFRFLHELGIATARDGRESTLHRFLVEGVVKVTCSTGGALYVYDEAAHALVPRYYSDQCAPLLPLSALALEQVEVNPFSLLSSLRLQTVAPGSGLIGHVFAQQRPEHVADLLAHPQLQSVDNALQRNKTVLIGPVTSGDRKLGVLALSSPSGTRAYTANDFEVFTSLIEQAAFALGHAMTHQELQSKRLLDAEMKTAGDVQRILLPDEDPVIAGFFIAGKNRPARVLSGDFYDYVHPLPGCFGAVIADVSGKGLPAALVAATCRSSLQAHAQRTLSPAAVLAQVNRQVFEDIHEDMFVSMIYFVIDEGGQSITLARAGHPEPMLWRAATGKVETLRSGGLGVGIDSGEVFERVTKDFTFTMASGDCLLLYTDGVNEAENAEGDEFGEERIKTVLAREAKRGAQAVVDRLTTEVDAFVGNKSPSDDITLVVLQKR